MARNTNFYYSFLVLPAEKRRAITAVWDFCRAVDDAVDCQSAEQGDGSSTDKLLWWRDELAACYTVRSPVTPQGINLKPHVSRFRLPRCLFEELIDGVEMDIVKRRYRTFEDLYQYCRRVASAVGLLCIEIFGYRDQAARDYAVALGVALQLTNIIRDLQEDLRVGRLYLPTEDLKRFSCTEEDLQKGCSDKVASLLRFECERAREFYSKARLLLPAVDRRQLVAAEIMGGIYFSILRQIELSDYDVFSKVIRVSRIHRALIAAGIWLRTMVRM
ncbi:MAG: squalene synthase HpnD [Acidobacteria bacterium]|nr:squalene synthase HpnD [Acidobacteriota bacterium]